MNSLGMHIIVDKNRNELLWVSDECKICMGWAFSIWGEGKEKKREGKLGPKVKEKLNGRN